MTERVTIVEVGPRDGLQSESGPVTTADKVRLVDLLSDAGLPRIEVTSFVSPKWVPQLADAAEVMALIRRRPGIIYTVLTPNLQGFVRARAAGADEVAVFASASEIFSQKNINCSIDESLARFAPLVEAARDAATPVRGYVSCVTDCPYEGPVAPAAVARVVAALAAMGCHEVSLGDTIGRATPATTAAMLGAVLGAAPADRLASHFHDTGGRALQNIDTCLDRGLRVFDAAAGGLGGCPYAPGASGNVATEAVAAHLAARGFATGIDPARLATAAAFAASLRSPR